MRVTMGNRAVALFVGVLFAFLLSPFFGWVGAKTHPQYTTDDRPPDGSVDYPVPLNRITDYWIQNCPVSEATVKQVDKSLEELNADHIVQTMVLCMPADQVTNPGVYSLHFLRYMKLGLAEGPRRNNGFVWLVLYGNNNVNVVYGAGDGVPMLTSGGLMPMSRNAEKIFKEKGIDAALIALTNDHSSYARSVLQPWQPVPPQYGGPNEDAQKSQMLFWGIVIFVGAVLISEIILAFFVVLFGSYTAWDFMDWPFHFLLFCVRVAASASSKGGSYSGSSSGGGGGRSGGGGGGGHRTGG